VSFIKIREILTITHENNIKITNVDGYGADRSAFITVLVKWRSLWVLYVGDMCISSTGSTH
jgi:hypothetical protein